jgi:hypothetical protein
VLYGIYLACINNDTTNQGLNMNLLQKTLALSALALTCASAQAEFISSDDWWLTTDNFGGLKQSITAPNYFFAVSKENVWDTSATYGNIDGYRIATTAEGQSVFNQNNYSGNHTYYNQGGWSGYNWEGKPRYYFRFADSVQNNAYKHSGNYDEYHVQFSDITSNFAGFVMVRDETATSLPNNAPHATAADVSAPALFGAGLGLLLMGLRRRQA